MSTNLVRAEQLELTTDTDIIDVGVSLFAQERDPRWRHVCRCGTTHTWATLDAGDCAQYITPPVCACCCCCCCHCHDDEPPAYEGWQCECGADLDPAYLPPTDPPRWRLGHRSWRVVLHNPPTAYQLGAHVTWQGAGFVGQTTVTAINEDGSVELTGIDDLKRVIP